MRRCNLHRLATHQGTPTPPTPTTGSRPGGRPRWSDAGVASPGVVRSDRPAGGYTRFSGSVTMYPAVDGDPVVLINGLDWHAGSKNTWPNRIDFHHGRAAPHRTWAAMNRHRPVPQQSLFRSSRLRSGAKAHRAKRSLRRESPTPLAPANRSTKNGKAERFNRTMADEFLYYI